MVDSQFFRGNVKSGWVVTEQSSAWFLTNRIINAQA